MNTDKENKNHKKNTAQTQTLSSLIDFNYISVPHPSQSQFRLCNH
jgi:hypothetical protein